LEYLHSRNLVTFHDGFSYLAQAFDLEILHAIEEESGSEASASELIEIINLIEANNIRTIFTESNGSVSAADIISKETNVAVKELDMCMGSRSYFDAMYHNIDTLKEALG
jgi:ABC-type Zn uptake system ZnuABC Zn-binding protein ZnuA